MTLPPVHTIVLGLIPCLIPPYALRLYRVLGTKRVGGVLFAVFSLLAVVQLMRAWRPLGLGLEPGLTIDLLNFFVPVLLLVGMVHIETLFRERLRLEEQEKKLRGDLENQVRERTTALDKANEELQREISLRRQGAEELRKSKEQYRFLFDENPQPMWIYDLETFQFLVFNAAALRHYGFSRAEFREMKATGLCPPGDTEIFVADSAKTVPGVQRRGLWRHCRKDGAVIEVEITALDLTYDSRPARLVLAHDVTAQRLLQKQLLQSKKMQVAAQVAGGVADRFSLLIAALETDANYLAQNSLDPALAERAKRIAATAAGASGLTRQLLALVGRHPMQSQILDLNKLIENQLVSLARQLGDKIVVETSYWSNLPPIAGDPALVMQILQHLVTNAREAMPEGGTLTLSTAAVLVDESHAHYNDGARTGAFVCLGVADTGCGMTPEVQARLFEPFFTTKDAGKAEGLGLASVHGLVKQHGGWLEVHSQSGAGTRIGVFFPSGPTPGTPRRWATTQSEPVATPVEVYS
jgi:two-component system cell cycle sensor histidine kinase/response regulator CckA